MFEWNRNNLRKLQSHRIKREEAKQALVNDPIPIYEQDVSGESRFVYYGETNLGRLLAVIITERGDKMRVVTSLRSGCRAKARLSREARARRVKSNEK